ncbi:MAG TPA: DNA primase [Acidobacteriota bacterium]|nr:DNA primase [Acidobacteriota bacterium]
MAAGENFLAQLKGVVDPLTIFSHYLSLKKSGNRHRALCPFHSEKTPSFYASENGMFHCFGCGTGGDVIKFVMLMEKLDFKECIQLLSSRYGIPLRFVSAGEKREKDQLLDLMRQAAEFYHNLLTTHASGQEALDYLEQRGVTRETMRRFQLGWAPAGWTGLLEHFQKRDVPPALLEKCGLVVARQQEGYYDRYRSRVMIPIHDIHGNIIALGGRIFHGTGEEAKYLNSPESAIYSKSHHLFGLYFSKDAIQSQNAALLVEGYFDMIMPFQAGQKNIAASLGTSLTENQARLLRRYTDRVVLFYDPDPAGRAAVLRAIPILLHENFAVNVATLPSGLDPDKLVRERGAAEFESQIQNALRYDQLFLGHLAEAHDLRTSAGKLAATEDLTGLLAAVANPFERDQLINRFSSVVAIAPQIIQDHFRRKTKLTARATGSKVEQQKIEESEKGLLQIFLMAPEIAREMLPQLMESDYQQFSRADLFRQLDQIITTEENLNTAEVIHAFPADVQNVLTSLVMEVDAPTPTLAYAQDWLRKIRDSQKDKQRQQLNTSIEEATKASDQDKLDQLLKQKLDLGRETKIR